MTHTANPFGQVLVALVTPMTADGEVDWPAVEKHIDDVITAGADGIVVTGTTGETSTLTDAEKLRLVEVGKDVTAAQLRTKFDSVLLTAGSTVPRDLPIPGRDLKNIHFAMDFLGQQQEALFNQNPTLMDDAIAFRTPFKGNKDWKLEYDGSFIDVRGKKVGRRRRRRYVI